MARRRWVSTDISTDKKIVILAREAGDFGALLYTWMIPHAEEDGGLTADCDELRMKVVPGLPKTTEEVGAAIEVMIRLGLIEYDATAERLFFPYERFYKYQSNIKPANRRQMLENIGKQRETLENVASVSSSVSVSSSATATPSAPPRETGPWSPQQLDEWKAKQPTAFKCYEQLFGVGRINDIIRQDLLEVDEEWEDECIEHCFREAARANARSWNLVRKILDEHKSLGCYAGKPGGAGNAAPTESLPTVDLARFGLTPAVFVMGPDPRAEELDSPVEHRALHESGVDLW